MCVFLQRISQSYVELPPNYPKRIASGRTEELRDLFNDFYVAVTSGSEDYSFKVRPFPVFDTGILMSSK